MFVPQSISSHPLPAFAVCGVQVSTGMFGLFETRHVVPMKPFATLGGSGTQVPACTGVFKADVTQSVR